MKEELEKVKEQNIRISNIYRVTYKKWLLLMEERKRHLILIDQYKKKIKKLERKLKEHEDNSSSK